MLALLLACAACGTEAPDEPPVVRPPVPYSITWSASDGIDVRSRAAELVRASMESTTMARWAGVDYAFPGYREALSEIEHLSPRFRSPRQGPQSAGAPALYMYRVDAIVTTANNITATVCTLRRSDTSRGPVRDDHPSSFVSETEPATFDVELSRSGDDPDDQVSDSADPAAPSDRRDNAKVPTWNVFDDWRIRTLDSPGRDGDYVTQPGCTAWWRQVFPGWTAPVDAPWSFAPPHPVTSWVSATGVYGLPPNYPEWVRHTDAPTRVPEALHVVIPGDVRSRLDGKFVEAYSDWFTSDGRLRPASEIAAIPGGFGEPKYGTEQIETGISTILRQLNRRPRN